MVFWRENRTLFSDTESPRMYSGSELVCLIGLFLLFRVAFADRSRALLREYRDFLVTHEATQVLLKVSRSVS